MGDYKALNNFVDRDRATGRVRLKIVVSITLVMKKYFIYRNGPDIRPFLF